MLNEKVNNNNEGREMDMGYVKVKDVKEELEKVRYCISRLEVMKYEEGYMVVFVDKVDKEDRVEFVGENEYKKYSLGGILRIVKELLEDMDEEMDYMEIELSFG